MARDVHQRTALVVHVATELGQAVDDLLNGLLIAGDRRCGDDHRIALMDGERLVLAVGHAGKRRERLALGAGAHDHDLILGQTIDVESIDKVVLVNVLGTRAHGRHACS